ncbi:MAG: transposase [Terracidiphilus sp.]
MPQDILAPQEGSEKFARKSKRELFLDRMEQVVPWEELLALVESHDLTAGSQPPAGLSILLRIFFVQQWFNLSDSGAEDALYESPVLRSFVGIDLGVAPAPDEAAIRHFRQLIEERDWGGEILVRVNTSLVEQGIHITIGKNADATIHDVSSLTRYAAGEYEQPGDGGKKAVETGAHLEAPGAEMISRPTKAKATDVADPLFPCTGDLYVAVISPDTQRRNAALRALGDCHTVTIQEFLSYPADLDSAPRTLNREFDIVLVDLDTTPKQALNLVESISVRGLAIAMVYSAQADPDLLLRAMRVGAREFLTLPFNPGAMADALIRASALRSVTRPQVKADGRLLVFLGAKGGSGVTTLACNYAVSLAQDPGQKTLLIDLNLPLGDAAINLGIKPRYSTVNALQNSSRLDASFLSTMLIKHGSGLSVLAAPSELATVQFSDDAVDKLLKVAREAFDYVVVDAGSRLDLQHTILFEESDTIYLVTQIGIPDLRNSNRLISLLSTAGSPKLSIVINRYDPRSLEIDEYHIIKAFTRPADWKIPNNYVAVRRMQNTATSLMEDDSEISRAIRQMTRSVSGQPTIPEKKKGFSFFR